jgi:receptor protein-tyrosine kinase
VTSQTPRGEYVDTDLDVETTLIRENHLTDEAASRIREMARAQGISFIEAAVKLGLLLEDGSPANVKSEAPGLVEAALRRASTSRQIVLRQGEPLSIGSKLKTALDPYHPRNERMRVLRTELLLLNESNKSANIIALVSAEPEEGRSQLAAELAISFAQLGRRTLLVDADMRRPQQHVWFGSENQYGLSRALTENSRPYLHPIRELPSLFLCPAGEIPSNPLELLSDGRFERLVNSWRTQNEFIVIDTPPTNQCADALAVATVAGRVLIVSRAQRSSYKCTKEMMRRLAATQAKILGSTISNF